MGGARSPGADGRWAVNGRFLSEPFSGVQRVSTGFLRCLAARHGVLLVAPAGHRPEWWSGSVREAPLPRGRPGRLLWEQTAVPGLSGRRRVLSLANTAPLLRRDMVMIHDIAFATHPEWFRRSFRLAYGTVTLTAGRASPRVIVPSEFTAKELTRVLGIDRGRVSVVQPGIDGRFRPASDHDVCEVRARYRLPELFFLSVASIDPRKGLGTAARAATAAGVPLVVAGGRVASFAAAEVPGQVRWLGRVPDDDLPSLYTAAAALLFPSVYEGFGLPPLEAMACGTPVVASDLEVLRETLAGAAVLVAPDDADGWTEAARSTLRTGTRAALVSSGRERADRYTWDRAGAQLSALMDAWPDEP
jgi:glycosyltransferase involved in cell wall biosynthesis